MLWLENIPITRPDYLRTSFSCLKISSKQRQSEEFATSWLKAEGKKKPTGRSAQQQIFHICGIQRLWGDLCYTSRRTNNAVTRTSLCHLKSGTSCGVDGSASSWDSFHHFILTRSVVSLEVLVVILGVDGVSLYLLPCSEFLLFHCLTHAGRTYSQLYNK